MSMRGIVETGNGPVETLYVIGGRQRAARSLRDGQEVWQGYDKGLVLRVEVETRSVSTCFETSARASHTCVSASLPAADVLVVCGGAVVVDPPPPELESLPHAPTASVRTSASRTRTVRRMARSFAPAGRGPQPCGPVAVGGARR